MSGRYRSRQSNVAFGSQQTSRKPEAQPATSPPEPTESNTQPIQETTVDSEATNKPIVIALPSWVGSLNPVKIFNPMTVILLLVIGCLCYVMYTNRSLPEVGGEKAEIVTPGIVSYDFGNLDDEEVAMIKKFVAALVSFPEKDFKSKAKIMATMDLDSLPDDEARLSAVNSAMVKSYSKDSTEVASALAELINAGLMDEAGEYMTAITKKTKPKRK